MTAVFAGEALSELGVEVGAASFEDCLVCFAFLADTVDASLPLFAFLSFRNWIRGVVVTFSLLLPVAVG